MRNRLRTIVSEFRGPLVAAVITQSIQSYIGLSAIVFFQRIVDALGASEAVNIGGIIGIYAGLTAANHLLIWAQGYPQRVAQVGTALAVKRMVLRKLSTIDYQAYTSLDIGTTVQIAENGANAGSAIINNFWLLIAVTMLTLPVQLYLIQTYDGLLLLIVVGGYGVLFAIAQLLMRASKAAMEKVVSRKEELAKKIARAFRDLVNMRVMRLFPATIRQAESLSKQVVKSEGRIRLLNELFFTGFALLVFVVEVVVITRHAALIATGASTVGTLVALVLFVRSVFGPVAGFSYAYVGYKMNRVAWRRFEELMDLPDDPDLQAGDGPESVAGGIRLDSVSFGFDGHPVIADARVLIEGGKRTAIVGASGAGKSTTVRLILGLLKPSNGAVNIGGTSLRDVSLDDLYRNVAYVAQDAPIIDGSLRSNLGADAGELGEDDVREALAAVGLPYLIERLDADMGEGGIALSAGERQRVGIARAMLSNAELLILDEPTSSLDGPTELSVVEALLQRTGTRTVVVVAHRLELVRRCDQIIVLDGGRIVEQGSFEELLAAGGRFAELWTERPPS